MNFYKPLSKTKHYQGTADTKSQSLKRLMSRDFSFVYQVLREDVVIGGGPLMGSLREAQNFVEEMVADSDIQNMYWSSATSVVIYDKNDEIVRTIKLKKT